MPHILKLLSILKIVKRQTAKSLVEKKVKQNEIVESILTKS